MEEQYKSLLIGALAFIGVIICLAIAIYLLNVYEENKTTEEIDYDNVVAQVIDGDTFMLETGETFKLLCVNTPEKNKPGYQEATDFLKQQIESKNVRIDMPDNFAEKDIYDRFLAFAYVKDNTGKEILVNKQIIANNFSYLYNFNNTAEACKKYMDIQ